MKLLVLLFLICVYETNAYFTLEGDCPQNIKLQEDFRLADFYGRWYQAYHYSSDNRNLNNCSTIELVTRPDGIYLNQSRVDRGLFHRYSMGKLVIPPKVEDGADLKLEFHFENAPRRLTRRTYPFRVLSTNYNYYAAVYTCQYSPLINKHYVYVWILSRNEILNDVSKELALQSIQQLDIDSDQFQKDERKCSPKYYEEQLVEPTTFRYPVPI